MDNNKRAFFYFPSFFGYFDMVYSCMLNNMPCWRSLRLVLSWHKQYDWILCWQLYTLTSLQTNTWIATWRPTNGLYAYLLVFTVKKSNTQTKFEVIVCSGFFHMLSDWNGLVFPLDLIQGKTCAFYWGIIVGQFWNNFLGVGWSSFWTILSFFYCSFENFKRIKTYVTVANFHFFFS